MKDKRSEIEFHLDALNQATQEYIRADDNEAIMSAVERALIMQRAMQTFETHYTWFEKQGIKLKYVTNEHLYKLE